MKKILILIGFIIVIGVCLLIIFFDSEKLKPDNPAGKTVYYTVINDLGEQGENGRYNYELTAYDEKGKEKNLTFSTRKQLRKGAYIQLYYIVIRGVTHWEEVNFEEFPESVQQQYKRFNIKNPEVAKRSRRDKSFQGYI